MLQTQIKTRRAFTLIELLMVLVILAILAAVVMPKFVNRGEYARVKAAKAEISNISGQLDTFEVDTGRYPSNEEGLAALMEAPANIKNWNGPYLTKLPTDPWGNPYVYRFPGQNNRAGFDLYSQDHDGGDNPVNNWSQ